MIDQQKMKNNVRWGDFHLTLVLVVILFNLTGCNEAETTRQREILASNERIAATNAASNVDAAVKAANVKADADIKIAEINFIERSKIEIQRLASEAATAVKQLETNLSIEKIQQEASIAKIQIWQKIIDSLGWVVGFSAFIWGMVKIARERTLQIAIGGLPLDERVKFINQSLNRSAPPYLSQAAFKRLEKQALIH